MKQNLMQSLVTVLLLIMIIISPHTSARKLATKQGQPNPKINKNNISSTTNDSSLNVMGVEEECINEDEECLKRRLLLAEAHLDYIYTQHHLP